MRSTDDIAKAEAQIRLMRRGADPARGPALTTAQLAGLPRETLSQQHVAAIAALVEEAGDSEALPSNPLQHFGFLWWRNLYAHEPYFSLEGLNLSGVTLAGVDLRGANVKNVDFTCCKLLRPVIDRWMQWGDVLTAENCHILWPLVGVARPVNGTTALYTVRPDKRCSSGTSTDALGHTHAIFRIQEQSAILAIPIKHRQAFETGRQPASTLIAMDAYLAHPLADAEGLRTLTPHLAIFPAGSKPHQDMQTALTNRYLLACIREGKDLPDTPPQGMTPDKYAEYQAIVQHTLDVSDDIVAKWVRYPLTPTTIIDALLAIKDGTWSFNNALYLLRYPTIALYEKMESFTLLFACGTIANAGLTPAALTAFTVSNPLLAIPTLAIMAFSLRNGIGPLAKAAGTLALIYGIGDQIVQNQMLVDFINTHSNTLKVLANALPIATEIKAFYNTYRAYQDKPHRTPEDDKALQASMAALMIKISQNLWRLATTVDFDAVIPPLPGIPRDATMPGGPTITCHDQLTNGEGIPASCGPGEVLKVDQTTQDSITASYICEQPTGPSATSTALIPHNDDTPSGTHVAFKQPGFCHVGVPGALHATKNLGSAWTVANYGTGLFSVGSWLAQKMQAGYERVRDSATHVATACHRAMCDSRRRIQRPTATPTATQ